MVYPTRSDWSTPLPQISTDWANLTPTERDKVSETLRIAIDRKWEADTLVEYRASAERRARAERHAHAMADVTEIVRRAILHGAALAKSDPVAAVRYLTAASVASIAHKSRLRRVFKRECRDCAKKVVRKKGTSYSSRDTTPVAPPEPLPETPPALELHGPSDAAARTEWERTVRRFQTTRPQRKGCQAWSIGQQAFDFAEFRTLTVHCGCWDCGVCGPRVATMWYEHLLPFLREAGPLFLVKVAPKAWGAFTRRIQRAKGKGDHVRALCADGSFTVLTTIEVHGAVSVADPEAALYAMLAACPRSTNGSARRITTSAAWKQATRRGAKKAEPAIAEAAPTETHTVPTTPWQTTARAPVGSVTIRAVLEDEGLEFAVHGSGRKTLVTRWACRDQLQGARIWARIFAVSRRRVA